MGQRYSSGVRVFETTAIFTNGLLSAVLVGSARDDLADLAWMPSAGLVALGWILADLASGVVHWLADTWGSERIPVIGPVFVRSFREHHVDPEAITKHDWIETNGANSATTIPILSGLVAASWAYPGVIGGGWVLAVVSLNFWTVLGNQIHKWAHMVSPPRWVRWGQRCRIFISPDAHRRHHNGRHDDHFCITSGILNGLLGRLEVFRRLEKAVTLVTGYEPRGPGF